MKFRSDFVTNSSSSSFVTYLLSDGAETIEIEFCDTMEESCEYEDEADIYERLLDEDFCQYHYITCPDKNKYNSIEEEEKAFEDRRKKFREECMKNNPPPKKKPRIDNLANVRALNKLMSVNSFGEMADLLCINKERGKSIFSVYDGNEHKTFNSLREMIDLYENKGFKPKTIVFMKGNTEKYMASLVCDYKNRIFEAKGIDANVYQQVILDLENKHLILHKFDYEFATEEELYSTDENEFLEDEKYAEKRDVYYIDGAYKREYIGKEMKISNDNPNKVYFDTDK